jgi:hypothetical protein
MTPLKLGAVLFALVLAVPVVLASSPRTEYRPYNVGVGLTAGCPGGGLTSVGGTCFLLDGSESAVVAVVHDSTFQSGVPASWAIKTSADVQLSNGWFCDSSGSIPIPPGGAARFYVWVGGPLVDEGITCNPGLATTGLVQANFS